MNNRGLKKPEKWNSRDGGNRLKNMTNYKKIWLDYREKREKHL